MAIHEEKILGYLDGSLGEADREALLAEIAAKDGEARALFDAHIRLEELYTLVQKPVSAPLSVQRELASKLPMLAIKLPYLAAPADRRDRVAAGWFSSARFNWVNVVLIAAVLTAIGGIWYGVGRNKNNNSNVDRNSSSPTSITNNSAIPSAKNNSSTNNTSSASIGSIPSGAEDAASATGNLSFSQTHVNSYHTGTSGLHSASTSNLHSVSTSIVHSRSVDHAVRNSGAQNLRNISSRSNAGSKIPSQRAIAKDHASNVASSQSIHSTPQTPISQALQPPVQRAVQEPPAQVPAALPTQELPPLSISAVPVPDHALHYGMSKNILTPYDVENNSTRYTPVRGFALAGARTINYFKNGTNGNGLAPAYELGLDYEISPWIAAGVRVGSTSFVQMTTTASSPQNGYPGVKITNGSLLNSALWFGPAITGTLNPAASMRYSLSVAGGPAMTKQMGWIGIVSGDIAYDISDAFVLHIDPSFDISRITPATAPTFSNSTVGYVATPASTATTANAMGISAGISFHP